MTTTNSNLEEQLNFDFYFWLGEDGEASPVSEADFLARQNKLRLDRDNFLNVRIDSSSGRGSAGDGIDVVGD